MSFFETIKIIISQLLLLCCNPILVLIITGTLVAGFNIFSMGGIRQRIRTARNENRSTLPTRVLAFGLPFWFVVAIGFHLLASITAPIVYIIAGSLFILSLPLIILGGIIMYSPRIIPWMLERLGQYGERLLSWIENSPSPFLQRLRYALGNLRGHIMLWMTRFRWPRLFTDPTISDFLSLIGLSSDTVYMQIAHDPNAQARARIEAIRGLGDREAVRELYTLGMDTTASFDIRSQAAHQLQARRQFPSAAMVWVTIGNTSTNPRERLDAVEHLLILTAIPQATRLLNDIFTSLASLNPVQQIRAWYLRARIAPNPGILTNIETISLSRAAPSAFVEGATSLIFLGERGRAEALLVSIATDPAQPRGTRQHAIQLMRVFELQDALIQVLNHAYSTLNMRYMTSLALEACGNIAWAARGFRRIAQEMGNPLLERIEAADRLVALDQSKNTHDILWQLASSPGLISAQRQRIALALRRGNWIPEASQVLAEVISDPTTNSVERRLAERDLARIQSPDWGLPEQDGIG